MNDENSFERYTTRNLLSYQDSVLHFSTFHFTLSTSGLAQDKKLGGFHCPRLQLNRSEITNPTINMFSSGPTIKRTIEKARPGFKKKMRKSELLITSFTFSNSNLLPHVNLTITSYFPNFILHRLKKNRDAGSRQN